MSEKMGNHVAMDLELIAALYGPGFDPREVISKMGPDQSDVHVQRPLTSAAKKKKERSEKTQRTIALATNAVGVVGGPAAIYAAAKSPALKRKAGAEFRKDPKNAGPVLGRLHRLIGPGSKAGKAIRSPKALAAGAAGATALQVGNMTGDAISVKYFAPKKKKEEQKLSKKFVAQNLKPNGQTGQDQLKSVNSMFSSMKNTGLQPLAAKPAPKFKPMGTLKPMGTQTASKPALAKPKAPMTPTAPVSPVAKSDSEITWETEISKVDTEKRQVFGWATVTHVDGKEVVDLQDDYIPMEEIEKAAYNYVLTSRKGGDMHAREGDGPRHTADLIESVIFSPEKISKMGLDPDAFPKMGWWLGMKVNDEEQWELVKKGERTGFSIHGKGHRVTKEME
jgi:Putative phage serine protease XkdF